jgi:hypothetical protein
LGADCIADTDGPEDLSTVTLIVARTYDDSREPLPFDLRGSLNF